MVPRGGLAKALRLLVDDNEGRALAVLAAEVLAAWTLAEREADPDPPFEVVVLADWLEERGAGMPCAQLIEILDRRRTNR